MVKTALERPALDMPRGWWSWVRGTAAQLNGTGTLSSTSQPTRCHVCRADRAERLVVAL